MKSISTSNLIFEIWFRISKRRKRQLYLLISCIILSSFFESLTLALVFPFIQSLSNPNLLIKNQFLSPFFSYLNLEKTESFILITTLLLGISSAISGATNIFKIWFTERFTSAVTSDICIACFKNIINQSYIDFTNKNSSFFTSTLVNEIRDTQTVIYSFLKTISAFLLLGTIFITLLFINFKFTLYSIMLLLLTYLTIGYFVKFYLLRNSKLITLSNNKIIKLIQEAFGNIKDIILYSNQKKFLEEFSPVVRILRIREAQSRFLGQFTKYFIESIGLIIISGLTCYLLLIDSGNEDIIPTLGVLTLGALKISSPIQQIYINWAYIKAREAGIERVLEILKLRIKKIKHYSKKNYLKDNKKTLIEFKNLKYGYEKIIPNVLNIKTLKIEKGEIIGIIGSTGSGKTTLLDIIMGLLVPTEGKVYVNGKDINSSEEILRSWQKCITHVPQEIYLFDSSIKENIICTSLKEEFKEGYFNEILKMTLLDEFVKSKDKTFDTLIGERGSALSGGQRQRIGIARALYRNTKVLIFDEGTSALDLRTESQILKNINNLRKDLTIIMVAHRLSTLKNCDRVFKLNKGLIENTYSKEEFNYLLSEGLL